MSRLWFASIVLLAGCGEELIPNGPLPTDCQVTSSRLRVNEVSDLGFSPAQLQALVGDVATYDVTYPDDTLGHADDVVTFTRTGPFLARRVSRTGPGCDAVYQGGPDVVRVVWPVQVDLASGDAGGAGTMGVEAASLDPSEAYFFQSGTDKGRSTFAPHVWDAFFAQEPTYSGAACQGSLGWGGWHEGDVLSARWTLAVYCDVNGDGSPNRAGGWYSGQMTPE